MRCLYSGRGKTRGATGGILSVVHGGMILALGTADGYEWVRIW